MTDQKTNPTRNNTCPSKKMQPPRTLTDKTEKQDLDAASESFDLLTQNIFPDLTVGLMHGKLDPDQKNKVMKQFMNHEIQILGSNLK